MCGICGILGASDQTALESMVRAMHHRGPDDHGEFFSNNISLGMARLSIIDTSPCGHQPMTNKDNTIWLVYNGETYNFRELRKQLEDRGYRFNSTSDTEVILHLYEEYGDDCVLRLQGMFAFALYDSRNQEHPRTLIARDPIGIKPLLFAHPGSTFIFASEMKGLLASGYIPPHIDAEALRLLLTFGSVPQPRTIISGVRMLLPGHRLIFENGTITEEIYWELKAHDPQDEVPRPGYEELQKNVRNALETCVRQQMVSDVPVGAFLSGGIDSSIIVALMARASTIPVKTFSVGFEGGIYRTDEADEAERIAGFIGTDHTRVTVTGDDVRERIHHFASALDQPSVDGLNSYFVSLAASRSVKVAISGTGGDEIFAGYPWFIRLSQMAAFQKEHSLISYFLEFGGRICQDPFFNRLTTSPFGRLVDLGRGQGGFLSRYSRFFVIFPAREVSKLLSPPILSKVHGGNDYARDYKADDVSQNCSVIQRVSSVTLKTYTRNQLLRDIDAVSMAHSLEVRVPYLDHHLIRLVYSLPDETKLGTAGGISSPGQSYRTTGAKRILIDSCRDLIPPDLDIQEKRGFGMPFRNWLEGPLKDIVLDTLSPESVRKRGLFNVERVEAIKKRFYGNKSEWAQIWLLMIIELWCREVLDKVQPCNFDCRRE